MDFKFDDEALRKLVEPALSSSESAVDAVVQRQWGTGDAELILEELRDAMRGAGFEPNESGLRPIAEAVAEGRPLPD